MTNDKILERQKHYKFISDLFVQTIDLGISDDEIWREFKKEIDSYSVENYEPAARGARLTAAIKRYKTDCIMHFIFRNVLSSVVDSFDITPATFRKLSKALFDGRSGSQTVLVSCFGRSGRTRKASKGTHNLIDGLAKKHKAEADKLMFKVNTNIESAKSRYRAETRSISPP